MNRALTWLVAIMGLAGFILLALESYNDSAAKRLYAQSAIIAAKSAARQDFMAAALPYTILGLGLIGLVLITGLIIFGILAISRQSQINPSPQVIEKHFVYLLPSGQGQEDELDSFRLSRRQTLKRLSSVRHQILGGE